MPGLIRLRDIADNRLYDEWIFVGGEKKGNSVATNDTPATRERVVCLLFFSTSRTPLIGSPRSRLRYNGKLNRTKREREKILRRVLIM